MSYLDDRCMSRDVVLAPVRLVVSGTEMMMTTKAGPRQASIITQLPRSWSCDVLLCAQTMHNFYAIVGALVGVHN